MTACSLKLFAGLLELALRGAIYLPIMEIGKQSITDIAVGLKMVILT